MKRMLPKAFKRNSLLLSLVSGALLTFASVPMLASDALPTVTDPNQVAATAAAMADFSPLPTGFIYSVGSNIPGMVTTVSIRHEPTNSDIILTKMEAALAPKGSTEEILNSTVGLLKEKSGFTVENKGVQTVAGTEMSFVEGTATKPTTHHSMQGVAKISNGAVFLVESTAGLDDTKLVLNAIKGFK